MELILRIRCISLTNVFVKGMVSKYSKSIVKKNIYKID